MGRQKARGRVAPPTQKTATAYRQLWRVIDGAVVDAFNKHANYLAPDARTRTVRNSIVKRVVGAVLDYAATHGGGGDNAG